MRFIQEVGNGFYRPYRPPVIEPAETQEQEQARILEETKKEKVKHYKEEYEKQGKTQHIVNTNKPLKVSNNDTFFFSYYNLGNVAENDSTPCIGASNKDLCAISKQGIQTIALTVDIRKKLGIKFGDNIKLKKSNGEIYDVQVHDEMNLRYRIGCIKRQGYCVKGDIAYYGGKSINGMTQGVYSIIK